MSHVIPELDAISDQLGGKGRKVKPKILVVDDEPDNLDLLYRTFRRDFQVLKASSGIDALSVLTAEGEVAVIISDQRMPEMKGTEFLSKTVPQFPNTIRIILTGFTDVEDLVEAINSGQVYKYITKPWDPGELKDVVKRATETYALLRQRTHELDRAQQQATLLKALVEIPHQTETLEECLNSIATSFGKAFTSRQCTIHMVDSGQLGTHYGRSERNALGSPGAQDPLIQEAIASQNIQLFLHTSTSDHHDYYEAQGVGTHLVIPLMQNEATSAVLSLQWDKDFTLDQEDVSSLHLISHQLALSLACLK